MVELYWWNEKQNAGDYFNTFLFNKLNIEHHHSVYPNIVCVGSLLGWQEIKSSTKICGVGFMNACDTIPNKIPEANIYGVRGKLSLQKLSVSSDNIVLGDPGLLASKVWKKKVTKKYKYGIACYREDLEYFSTYFPEEHIIDIGTDDIDRVFKEINECEFIFSCSLHGIVFAHSFGIPAIHLEKHFIGSYDNFKFKDYYSILDIPYTNYRFRENFNFVDDFINNKEQYKPNEDLIKDIQERIYKMIKQATSDIIDQKPIFGIVSWFPDKEPARQQRIDRINRLFKQLEEIAPDIDILVIAQNWQDYVPTKRMNKLIIKKHPCLGILGARKMLREEFFKLDKKYSYIIMFDDDAIVVGSKEKFDEYLKLMEINKDGFCFIRRKSPLKFNPFADSQLNLCAISRCIYEKENIPEVDAQKGIGFEDRVYSCLLYFKYSKYYFDAPEDLYCDHFKNPNEVAPSTWAEEKQFDWERMVKTTENIEKYIFEHKDLPKDLTGLIIRARQKPIQIKRSSPEATW